jgi:N12 class adenine-specific DNA methylase
VTKKDKLTGNIEAIDTAFRLEQTKQVPGPEDRKKLLKYSGFGELKCVLLDPAHPEQFAGNEKNLIPHVIELQNVIKAYCTSPMEYAACYDSLKRSVLTSFYTPPAIVQALKNSLGDNHLSFGNVLEPSAGIGAFLTVANSEKYTAIEKDIITGKILKALNPDKNVRIEGFEKLPASHNQSYNLIVSNIPFGDFKVFDASFMNSKNSERIKACSTIHTYFFEKGLDMLANGGMLAFITTTGVMDSPRHETFRQHLLTGSHLITAVRLPENTFEDTKVQSDLIILQKDNRRHSQLSGKEQQFIKSVPFQEGIHINSCYADNAYNHVIHTSSRIDTDLYGKPGIRFQHERGIEGIAQSLQGILFTDIRQNLNRKLFNSTNKLPGKTVPIQLSLFDTFNEYVEEKPVKAEITAFEYSSKYTVPGSFQYTGDLVGIATDEKTAKVFVTENKQEIDIICQYTDLRDSYFLLKNEEAEKLREEPDLRRELNNNYDRFIENHSFLIAHCDLLSHDPSFIEIKSLEILKDGKLQKADIFFEPVAFSTVKEKYTLSEALSVSLNQFNRVNIDYICSLTRLDEIAVINGLEGQIFKNPETSQFETADVFLSGNVVRKLEKTSQKLETNPSDRYLANSVKALQMVQPARIILEDIGINLGERWIPEGYYSDFATYVFNAVHEIKYNPILDDFEVKGEYSYSAAQKYTVKSANRYYTCSDVMRFALLDNIPDMTKKVQTGNTVKIVPDTESIQKMNAVVSLLQNEFKHWINRLPVRDKEHLEEIYNRKFNCYVKPHFEGKFQTFPGLDRDALHIKDLYPSQKDAVLMLKNQNGGIIDHEVGGGKTLIMCVAAYEMKRLGLANKPCILGLKANIDQIAETFKKAYPEAKLLYATKDDLTAQARKEFFNKVQNNNWDCIIMTHEQFKAIPQSLEIQKEIITDEIRKIEETISTLDSDKRNFKTIEKGLIKRKENLEVKLKNIIFSINQKKDEVVDFRTMGIDHLFIDESHKFKNLMFQTRHQRVAGIGNSGGSDRAMNLLFAIRTIQERNGEDLGATFLSGTTISNSLTELYNIFNYLRPRALQEQGIFSFDAWASVFTLKSKDFEFNINNEIVQKERFRQFVKIPELALFYSQITDYRTASDIGVDRPRKNEILVSIEQTEPQRDMFERLKEFAKTGNGTTIYRPPLTEPEKKAIMLIATNTAKKAALDMRLINSGEFVDEPGNRVHAVTDKVFEYYQKYDEYKGTQFIFSDLGTYKPGSQFNIYSDIKQKLIEKGIPANEIQFIQMANTEKKRMALFEKMNNGTVRILIGSTEMLGTGVNAQKKCVAIHHFDIPWTPKDLEQRNGRGVRAGNEVAKFHADNKVDVLIYATKGTLDTYKFNLIVNKALFISQIKSNNLGVRTIDEGGMDKHSGMNYSEYIAVLSGNTDLMEKAKLEKQITQYKAEENVYLKQLRDRDNTVSRLLSEKADNERIMSLFKKDLKLFEALPKNEAGGILTNVIIGNKQYEYTDLKKIGEEINRIMDIPNTDTVNYRKIGSIGPFSLIMIANKQTSVLEGTIYQNKLFVSGNLKYSYQNGTVSHSPKLAGQYPSNALKRISGLISTYEGKNTEIDKKLDALNKLEFKFLNHDKLAEATKMLEIITGRINTSVGSNKNRKMNSPSRDDFNMSII